MPQFDELKQAIIDGKAPVSKELTEKMLKEGVRPGEFFPNAIIPAMDEVGRRMRECEFFIPEVLIAARAARASSDILRPLLVGEDAMTAAGTVVCGTVKGDLHDIGKNIVTFMLDINGFEVKDIGVDVPVATFLDEIGDFKPDVLGLSGFLTLAFDSMKETIDAIASAGLRDNMKIMIGGGQIDETVRAYTGADAFGTSAVDAVTLCRGWAGVAA